MPSIAKSTARPHLACEVAADRVVAARASAAGKVELFHRQVTIGIIF